MPDMNLKMLLTLEYWTAIRPVAQSVNTALMLSAFFALLFVLSFAFKSMYRKMKKTVRWMSYVWRKASTACMSLGIG